MKEARSLLLWLALSMMPLAAIGLGVYLVSLSRPFGMLLVIIAPIGGGYVFTKVSRYLERRGFIKL